MAAISTTRNPNGEIEAHVAGCKDLSNRRRHYDVIETIEAASFSEACTETDREWASSFGMEYPVAREDAGEVWSIEFGSIEKAPCLKAALKGEAKAEVAKPVETEKVKISWFAIADGSDERLPRQATMAGRWGWDATCSCGWDSRTGGAVFRAVRRMVNEHKVVAHGLDAKL